MKNHKYIFNALFILCVLFSNFTQASPDEVSIKKLLKLSGLTAAIEQFPQMISEGFFEGFAEEVTVTDDEKKVLMDDINQSFNASIFLNQIQSRVEKDLNQDELMTLLKWYESDLGKLITKAELKSTTDSAYNEIMSNAIALMKDTKRLEMAKKFDELLDQTNRAMKLQKKIALSVTTGIISSLESEQSDKLLAEFEAEIAGMEAMMRIATQQYIYVSFIYTYQDINDSDLGEYVTFLESNTYKKFDNAILDGLDNGFDVAIPNFTKTLASTIQSIIERSISEQSN